MNLRPLKEEEGSHNATAESSKLNIKPTKRVTAMKNAFVNPLALPFT